jgi:RimJ/RimL family protein N-acetyltransferase
LGYFDRKKDLLVGFLTIFYTRFHRVAELNTVIGDRDYWGQNVILGNCEPLFEFLFDTLGAEKVTGKAIAKNLPTIFVNKLLGFKVEGVLRQEWRYEDGQRMDVITFGMLPDDWRTRQKQKNERKASR